MFRKVVVWVMCVCLVLGAAFPAFAEQLPLEAITIYVPGDAPADLPQVTQAIEDACRDELNIDLEFVYAGWDDYGGKLQVALAAGQKYSLVYDASWGSLTTSIAGGYYDALDDLLPTHAPNLVSTKTEAVLSANRAKGPDGQYHIYGVPLGDYYGRAMQFMVRKDLREALNIAPITSEDELISYLYAVKEAYPELTPISVGKAAGNTMAAMLGAFELYKIPGYMWITDMGWEGVFYFKNGDGKVYNVFDDMPEALWEDILLARKLYQDGIIHPDVMSLPNWYSLVQDGSCGASSSGDIGVPGNVNSTVQQVVPEAVYEAVNFYDTSAMGQFATDYKAWDFLCLPSTSTESNKLRAIQFLDWVASSQENYDICAYGIEGVTWEHVGDKQFKLLSDNWMGDTWHWMRNAAWERYNSNYNEEDMNLINLFHNQDFFQKSPVTGFSFNAEPVVNQISQYNIAMQKYWFAIENGAVDPEEGMRLFREEAYDAVKLITAEYQRQIDEFLEK